MKLSKIMQGVKVKNEGFEDLDINEIKINTKEIESGDVYVCLKGSNTDGHLYVKEAKERGAVAIVCEREVDISLPTIIVDDSRETLSKMCSNYFDNPEKKMKIVSVVGTNGKTTVALCAKKVLDHAGVKCGYIGTLGVMYDDKEITAKLTTPDPFFLYKTLFDMANAKVEVCIFELSAHAIYLKKAVTITPDVAVFTNFSQDHLDYFKSMDSYKKVKKDYFLKENIKCAVLNADDELGRELISGIKCKKFSYGIDNPADVFPVNLTCDDIGITFVVNALDEIASISFAMCGKFNAENALAVITLCYALGLTIDQISDGVKSINGIKGRCEMIKLSNNAKIIIDYAHTPDGLKNIILSIKEFCTGRIITLFGCGGNRDSGKRKIMGEIAGELSDFTIITTDNPRYEDPVQIICDIEKGVVSKTDNYIEIQNREEAILYALKMSKANDVILIAGKGGEDYQEIMGIKYPFKDREIVERILNDD